MDDMDRPEDFIPTPKTLDERVLDLYYQAVQARRDLRGFRDELHAHVEDDRSAIKDVRNDLAEIKDLIAHTKLIAKTARMVAVAVISVIAFWVGIGGKIAALFH